MEATVENIDGNKTKVKVVVSAKDVDAKLAKVYRELANKYNFPGFRKGKAPRKVIDNALGAELALAQATEDVINDAYPEVIEEQRLFPVGSPEFSEDGTVEPGKDFEFEFTVGKKPEFELTSYDPIEIELPMEGATDAEIDDQIDMLTRHYESYEDAPEGTESTADNFAVLDMTATKEDGTEIESLTTDSRFFVPAGGLFSDSFDNEIFGMKAGDTKEFTLEVPEGEESLLLGDFAGQKVDFKVTCKSVQVKDVPELTDEFVKDKLGYDSVADLRKEVADSIAEQKAEIMPRLKESACKAKLIERVEDEVPENMAEEAETELLQDFFTQLQRQGVGFDAYLASRGIDADTFKNDVKMQAQDEAKEQLALDAWARKFNIEVTDEDVTHEFEIAGLENPKKTENEWRKSGRLYLIREGIQRKKAMDDIVDKAKVTEVDFVAREKDEETE